MADHLGQLLASTCALLLDFDGPICHPFAGYPASQVAADLRAFLAEKAVAVPAGRQGPDPLQLFAWVARTHPDISTDVENRLIEAERMAVRTATPTPSAHDLIRAAAGSGVPVAVVSNNSPEAIRDYLDRHDLADDVATVAGRPYGRPDLMKPNPHSLVEALMVLDVVPEASVFVGDSLSDVEAAQRAGTGSIGYAKDPTRVDGLTTAGADAVVESIGDLVTRWAART